MPAPTPTHLATQADLADVARVSILGNSGLGVKILPQALGDEYNEGRTVHVLTRLAAACNEVGRFPSLFFDVSEISKLPATFSNALTELIDCGLTGSGEVFFCGLNEGAQIESQLEQWDLLSHVYIDRGCTTFIPASADDREKFGNLLKALQALHLADELGESGQARLPQRPA